jgi:hypothetical protein
MGKERSGSFPTLLSLKVKKNTPKADFVIYTTKRKHMESKWCVSNTAPNNHRIQPNSTAEDYFSRTPSDELPSQWHDIIDIKHISEI